MDTDRILRLLVDDATSVIGVASIAAALLRGMLPPLRELAEKTTNRIDDAVVERVGIALSMLTILVEGLHKVVDAMGLNPPPKVVKDESGESP